MFQFKSIGVKEKEAVKELFTSVFSNEPWNDDWSDEVQLDRYINDLTGQAYSLTYGLYDGDELIAVSMGYIKHWFTGTEYCIDELCVRRDRQGKGAGTYFMQEIEKAIKAMGLKNIFLQTDANAPAYHFYKKLGFSELESHVSFNKKLDP
ncbi:MAG: GNAT family N-acetyltransferase [Lachnospiraceae bacterium]|nr:GNAT family N-acetyltransferase [Lachnospiraceae bacterium]